MDITQPIFLVFILISSSLYYLAPRRFRVIPLVIFNCLFLACFDLDLLLFMLVYSLINFLLLKLIRIYKNSFFKGLFLFFIVTFDVVLLFYFKYANFFTISANRFLPFIKINLPFTNLIAPIGLSFFTFKALSLAIDLYCQPTPSLTFANYFGYLTFFPQFLSGPIERYSKFTNDLKQQASFSHQTFFSGFFRIILGLFKKLLIANTIAAIINPVYANIGAFGGTDLLLTCYLFYLQIYFDFSGYTDIAIGTALLFGFVTIENFNQPLLSSSIKDFWRRWHISLSGWFRDYLYIPLGGNRHGIFRQILNILIVFLVTGFWHGAGFNFIFWGLLHGIFQVVNLLFSKVSDHLSKTMSIFLTFNLVSFSWIFFRSNSISDSFTFIKNILSPISTGLNYHYLLTNLIPAVILYLVFLWLKRSRLAFLRSLAYMLIILCLIFFSQTKSQDFLYFKF